MAGDSCCVEPFTGLSSPWRYASAVEWTPARIRLLRDVGLCQSQDDFAKELGVAKRTIGNAERGAHPPSLALRRALDQALQHASDAQRDRFLAAVAAHHTTTSSISHIDEAVAVGHPNGALDGLRSAVLRRGVVPSMHSPRSVVAATVQAHRLYQLADYDGAAQLLPGVLTCLQGQVDAGPDECLTGTLSTRHAAVAAYLAAAKLTTKLGDIALASVTADRAMTAATESEHPVLVGAATYQVACALLLTGELADAEQTLTVGAENMACISATTVLDCRPEELLSVRGSLLLLLAIVATRRGDHNTAQHALHNAGQLAGQLGGDGNWLWTAFGPTNVAIHELSIRSQRGDAKKAAQIAETIDTDSLPAVLRGRRSQVHIELARSAAGQADDAVAVLHLLEAERVAQQTVTRYHSARTLLSTLLARERRSVTPGLRGLATRAGVLP